MVLLTPKQKKLIPLYQEKWRKILLSTEPIDQNKVAKTIKKIYEFIGQSEPSILFFDSPYALVKYITLREINEKYYQTNRIAIHNFSKLDGSSFGERITVWSKRLEQILNVPFELQIDLKLYNQVQEILKIVSEEITTKLIEEIRYCDFYDDFATDKLGINSLYYYFGWYDFCVSEINIENYFIVKLCLEIHQQCDRLFAYPDSCLVYNRPCQISFDEQGHLHAQGKAAIQYNDGFCVSAFHGVRIPEE
ncbi:DUF6745 domain-containing protein [Nostoc sp. UHCC 0252]|uniref:DUF6745 domain-containing protein n=1 Tax=Nostoc sp. UHCC 0252 TaxID=3110241 RepID=UPI002B213E34|nr:hypothetical protein [Nostoc sp. UHCC 0252]MEA5600886.1 hypothetical protein [Nostoc sp. UHCC 0252]